MKFCQYKTLLNEKGLPELVSEKTLEYGCENLINPKQVADMMRDVFQIHRQTEEFMYEICLTTKGRPIGVFEISHGGVDYSMAGAREIMQKALICGAKNIVLVHNHPSGSCTPSMEDRKVANRIKEAGKIVGIELIDNIVIGGNEEYSFATNEW